MKTKSLLTMLITLVSFLTMQAHNIWIETSADAQIGKSQEVKVFFGESDSVTPTDRWFSNIKDFEIYVTSPSGKKIKIENKTKNVKYYSVSFVPKEKGVYVISLKHIVKDIFRKMKITYQAVALCSTDADDDSKKILGEAPLQLEIDAKKLEIDEEKTFNLVHDGKKEKRQKAVVEAANTWTKNLYSDQDGEVRFVPLWEGGYLIEYSSQKDEKGFYNGQPYEINYEIITLKLNTK